MKKKFIIFGFVFAAMSLIFVSISQSSNKSYYSGDSLVYQNKLYITTANTGSLELFRLDGDKLNRLLKIKPLDQRFMRYGSFYDSLLKIESGRLYVYAITDFSIYKYELVGSDLKLVNSVGNSFWEWYNRVDEIDGKLITVSNKGVKIWNNDLLTVDGYDFGKSVTPYNVRGNDHFLVNIEAGNLTVYNRESRKIVTNIALNFRTSPSAHKVYLDQNNDIYVVDDYYTKKFNLEGRLLSSFKHLNYDGFDVAASGNNNFIYFSNGVGVVQLNKNDLTAKDWSWTGGIAGPQGWAMGLNVNYLNGDKIVVFNNANILVLDDKLNKLAAFIADEHDDTAHATENLYLNLDKNRAPGNSQVYLSGGGFFPGEELSINLANSRTSVIADYRGRFTKLVLVPEVKTAAYDIKVDGLSSGFTYSISFEIE